MGKRKDSSGAALVGLATAVAYILYLRNKVLQRQVKKLNSERKDSKRKQGSSTATSTATSKNNSTSTTDYVMKEIGIISSPYPQRAGCPRQGLLAMSSRSILTLHDDIAKECLDGLAILIQEENVYHHGETKLPTE